MATQPTIGANRTQLGMKVKVSCGDLQLVIPCGNINDKVERLLKDISQRFQSYGMEPGELRLAQLQTIDGYIVSSNDLIKDVLNDDDRLTALTFDAWMQVQKTLLEKPWLSVVVKNIDIDNYAFISIGFHQYNKLYVKFGTGYPGNYEKLIGLELFEADSLAQFPKEGKILISSKKVEGDEGKINHTLEAFFIVEKGVAKQIELSCHSATDAKALIKRVDLKSGKKISIGQVHLVQSNLDTYNPKDYKLPAGEKKGPQLPPQVEKTKAEAPKDNKSSGTCPLVATQKGHLEPDQGWQSGENPFNNMLNINCGLFNNSNDTVSIIKVTAEYQDMSGNWTPVDFLYLGSRWGYYDYSFNDESNNFNMGPKDQRDLALRAIIKIDAPQFTARRRMHSTLPQPFVMRITFVDSNDATSVLTVTHVNGPLDLDTQKSREEYRGHPFELWMECDDTQGEGRIYAHAAPCDDNKYVEVYLNDRGINLYPDNLAKLAHQGVQENKTEVPLNDRFEEKGSIAEGWALVDIKNKRTYGLKLHIKTRTSENTQYYLLPLLKVDE